MAHRGIDVDQLALVDHHRIVELGVHLDGAGDDEDYLLALGADQLTELLERLGADSGDDRQHAFPPQLDAETVRAAMAQLPPKQRAALGLFYLEGLRVAEIAIALDTAPGTIKTRLMHARRNLRAQLEGEQS